MRSLKFSDRIKTANPLWLRLSAALLAALLLTAMIGFGALDSLDQPLSDRFYQKAGASGRDILVIGIDQVSLDRLGPLPWPRSYMAEAIRYLNNADPDARPAVIGIDILFSGEGQDPVADRELAQAAAQYGNVVVASAAEYGTELDDLPGGVYSIRDRAVLGWDGPFDALAEAAGTGHINAMADSDGIFRHALLYVDRPDGSRVYSFARVIYERWCLATGRTPSPLPKTSAFGFYYLPFSASGGQYCDGIRFSDLLDGDIDPSFYKDKIVLIGPYASGMQDAYPTSLNHAALMQGIDIQANIIEAFQKGFYPREASRSLELALVFFLCLPVALLFWNRDLRKALIIWLSLCLVWVLACALCYRLGLILHLLWVPAAVTALFLISVILNYTRIRREKLRIAAELDVARRIQTDMLPSENPPFPGREEFSLSASMTPAKEVGGDFYDFFLIDEARLGLVIGDVSGKGIPAALLMTVAMALLREHAVQTPSPAEALRAVNEILCARNDENMFVTVWLGILDLRTGELTAASAGHEYPILKTPGGSFRIFRDRHGLPVGAMENVHYREYTLQLSSGSVLFVYTDGLPEATNRHGEQLGLRRTEEILNAASSSEPGVLIRSVHEAVDAFVGSAPQFDDLTMLALVWHGAGNSAEAPRAEDGTPDTAP
ncbi:MAG: SpoIIE family protein phosphatase [Oscillospiraceae bacterium]|nr:SpoIIE family protein phosphatase [Oscillospiraceae bacterium]